jgi:hypothetical protein
MRRVLTAGLLGGIVLIAWTFVVNGILGFQASVDMKPMPAERQVYEILREHIVEPGRYICNPEVTSKGLFPSEEPVFSVLYGGVGHEAAGGLMLVGLAVFFAAPMIGAWMLSQTSESVKSSYPRKVLFFVAIGLLFAAFSSLTNFGIGRYPFHDALLLAANQMITWALVGLVVARWIQIEKG